MRLGRFSSWPAALAATTASLVASGPLPAPAQELGPKLPDLTGIVMDRDRATVLGNALTAGDGR